MGGSCPSHPDSRGAEDGWPYGVWKAGLNMGQGWSEMVGKAKDLTLRSSQMWNCFPSPRSYWQSANVGGEKVTYYYGGGHWWAAYTPVNDIFPCVMGSINCTKWVINTRTNEQTFTKEDMKSGKRCAVEFLEAFGGYGRYDIDTLCTCIKYSRNK